jgi:hypothetical protein
MPTEEEVLESIKDMPEDRFEDIDVLLERLVVLEKRAKGGERDIQEGRTYSTEEAKQQLSKWLK